MRTLKKTLCLVLCLAMMVGLCAVGASAVHFEDYPDKTEIKHVEAVTLLTELGILEGTLEGFEPTKGLTRAEAAALIVRMQNVDVTGLSSTFKDMQGHWADAYVGWLQAQGIVEGTGSGNFEPDAVLTFVDFAAMLLRTLGYDKDREMMTGKTYELGVLKLVNKLNFAHGIRGWEYNQPINRDDAAQLAYNALLENMVDYKENAIANVSVDENGNLLPGLREEIPNTAYSFVSADGKRIAGGDDADQMIERFWPKVKVWATQDDFGVPIHKWFTGIDTVDYKYTEDKAICTIEGVGIMAEYTTDAGTVLLSQVYADGNLSEKDDIWVLENGEFAGWIELAKNSKVPLGYGGATVLLIDADDDDVADGAIVKYAYLARVTGVIPADDSASGDREIEMTVYNGNRGDGYVKEVTFATELFSKGDYVLVYPSLEIDTTKAYVDAEDFNETRNIRIDDDWYAEDAYIIQVESAEVLSGKLTKRGMRNGVAVSITVAGEKHDIGRLAELGIEAEFALNKTATIYMNNGYVLGVTGEKPTYTHYVFKINDAYTETSDITVPEMWEKSATYKVGYVKQDGTTAVATVKDADAIPAEIGWYAPSVSGGFTKFTAPEDINDGALQLVAGGLQKISPKIAFYGFNNDGPIGEDGTVYAINADAKTEFVLYTATGYKHYTGVNNLPTWSKPADEGEPATAYALVVDNIAVAIFVDMRSPAWKIVTAPQANIFLLSSAYIEAEYDETLEANVYTYSGIVNGKFGTFQSLLPDLGLASGTLFEPKYTAGLVSDKAGSTANIGAGTVTVSYGTFVVNLADGESRGYVTSDKTTTFFYDANTGKKLEAGTAADISGKYGEITVEFASDGLTVASIYVYVPYVR